jgi:hypothetical protein
VFALDLALAEVKLLDTEGLGVLKKALSNFGETSLDLVTLQTQLLQEAVASQPLADLSCCLLLDLTVAEVQGL